MRLIAVAAALVGCSDTRQGEKAGQLAQADTDTCAQPTVTSICDVTALGTGGPWNTDSTWSTSTKPTDGQVVCINANQTVTLSGSPTAKVGQVHITGTLRFDPAASATLLSKGNVIVSGTGRLEMKPSSMAQTHTLTFVDVDETRYCGATMDPIDRDVGLWVTESGVLDAIGSSKQSWTRATTGIAAGATSIALDPAHPPTNWQVDDRVVITPTVAADGSETNYAQFEMLKVASVSGNSVTLQSPTQFAHPLVNGQWGAEVLNLTRNVKISGTCTDATGQIVDCESAGLTPIQRRAHVMLSHVQQTQTLKYLELFALGPRQAANGATAIVLGRYGLHFHMSMATGHLVEGVALHDIGSHAFVPHASHGMTIRDSISYNTWDEPFWWDFGTDAATRAANDTNDLVLDRDVAAWVNADPFQRARLAGFVLGGGQRNTLTNSVAVGVRGGATSAGFEWPENRIDSAWTFHDNVAHNNRIDGIFTWQNAEDKSPTHVIENSTVYNNGQSGIEHGAYENAYQYRNIFSYGNHMAGVRIHAGDVLESLGTLTFDGITIDGGGMTGTGFQIAYHNPQVGLDGATVVKNSSVKNLAASGKAVAWEFAGRALDLGDWGIKLQSAYLDHREWYRFLNNDFLLPQQSADRFQLTGFTGADGKSYGLTPLSDIYVSMPDGESYTLRALSFENPFTDDFDPPSAEYDPSGQAALSPKWYRGWTYARLSGAFQSPTRDASSNTGKVSGTATGSGLLYRKTTEAIDVNQTVLATVSDPASVAGLFARRGDGDERHTYYQADIGLASGSHPLTIRKVVDGFSTTLATASTVNLNSGVADTLEFQVITTTIPTTPPQITTTLKARIGNGAFTTVTDNDPRLLKRRGRFGIAVTSGPGTQALSFDHYTSAIDSSSITQDRFNAKIQQWTTAGTPIVNAGINTSAILPSAVVLLHGTAKDGGVDNPPGLIYTWSQLSGPSTATITSPSSRDTSVSFTAAGTYVLRLTANDGALTGSDDIQIVVSPAQADQTVDEHFPGANMSSWPTTWTSTLSGAPSTYVWNGGGVIQSSGPAFYAWMQNNNHSAKNLDIVATVQLSNTTAHGGLFARRLDSDPDTFLGVKYGYNSSAVSGVDDLRIYSVIDGEVFDLAALTLPTNALNTPQRLHFRVETNPDGTMNLRARISDASLPAEPTAWTVERLGYSNPIFEGRAGRFGVEADASVSGRSVNFRDLHADILDAPATTVVTETWTGASSSLWPSQWSGTPVAGTLVTIQNFQGQVSAPSGYGGILAYINNYQALGVDLVSSVRLSTNNARGGLVALYNPSSTTFVAFKFGATALSADVPRLYYYLNGVGTDIKTSTQTFTSGVDYKVHFVVEVISPTSANLHAKVCPVSNCPDDGTWTLEQLNWVPPVGFSLTSPGRFGVFGEEGQAGRITTFDDFQATFVAQ